MLTTHVQQKNVIKETALGPSHVVHKPSRGFWSWLKFHGVDQQTRTAQKTFQRDIPNKLFRVTPPEEHFRITSLRHSSETHPRETLQRYTPSDSTPQSEGRLLDFSFYHEHELTVAEFSAYHLRRVIQQSVSARHGQHIHVIAWLALAPGSPAVMHILQCPLRSCLLHCFVALHPAAM